MIVITAHMGKGKTMDNAVIFDRIYPEEKQAEGIAIAWAVTSGACTSCRLRYRCEVDPDFVFPKAMVCMVKKQEILKEWGETMRKVTILCDH